MQGKKIVDSREPEEIRTRLIELGWHQEVLISGDYSFYTHDGISIGITRKEVGDLMSSIDDTFSGQLEEMLDLYDLNILLLEGSWKHVVDGQLLVKGVMYQTWDMVWDYLHRWFAKGFVPELTTSMGHTIHRLNILYALYQKPYSRSGSNHKFADDRILAFPSGCRGESGIRVLEALGSLYNIAGTEPVSLERLCKISPKKAELIWNHFNRR